MVDFQSKPCYDGYIKGQGCFLNNTKGDTMTKYRVPVCITFTGTVDVEADDPETAQEIVRRNFRAMIGTCCGNNLSEIVDWDIGLHCDDVEVMDDPEEIEEEIEEE